MAQERLSMRKIKEVLRLKWGCGLPNGAVARSCRISTSTVSEYVTRAKAAGLSWPLPDDLDDAGLVAMLYTTPETPRRCTMAEQTLVELREKIEKHIKNGYLKRVDAPVGVKPALKCWMELNEG